MTAVIIFWAAMFAILFFLLGIICKALAAAFNTLVELTVYLGCILIIVGIVLIALYLIFGIVDDAVTKKNLTEFLVDMIWIAISIAILEQFLWEWEAWLLLLQAMRQRFWQQ